MKNFLILAILICTFSMAAYGVDDENDENGKPTDELAKCATVLRFPQQRDQSADEQIKNVVTSIGPKLSGRDAGWRLIQNIKALKATYTFAKITMNGFPELKFDFSLHVDDNHAALLVRPVKELPQGFTSSISVERKSNDSWRLSAKGENFVFQSKSANGLSETIRSETDFSRGKRVIIYSKFGTDEVVPTSMLKIWLEPKLSWEEAYKKSLTANQDIKAQLRLLKTKFDFFALDKDGNVSDTLIFESTEYSSDYYLGLKSKSDGKVLWNMVISEPKRDTRSETRSVFESIDNVVSFEKQTTLLNFTGTSVIFGIEITNIPNTKHKLLKLHSPVAEYQILLIPSQT